MGAGVSSSADVDVLSTEGDAESCAVAQREGTENYRCAVPLRIGLEALDAPATASCPEGSTLQGDTCLRIATDAPTPDAAPSASTANAANATAAPPASAAPSAVLPRETSAPAPASPAVVETPARPAAPRAAAETDAVVRSGAAADLRSRRRRGDRQSGSLPEREGDQNGFQDADGCPDQLPAPLAKFVGVVPGIDFDPGRSSLRPEALPTLDAATKVFAQYPEVRLRISVHTDNLGQAADNRALSGRRANALRDYLIDRGIGAGRVEARGAGQDEPIASNASEAGRAVNRRVEFGLIQ